MTTATFTKPWYKQFWVWFIILIPASAVVMGIALVYVATQNQVSLVRDDWYKDGLAINRRIDKQLQAKALGLTAEVSFSRENGALNVEIPDLSPKPNGLQLVLIHPTRASDDKTLNLAITPANSYWTQLNKQITGRYYLQISSPEQGWQLDGNINFNNTHVKLQLAAE